VLVFTIASHCDSELVEHRGITDDDVNEILKELKEYSLLGEIGDLSSRFDLLEGTAKEQKILLLHETKANEDGESIEFGPVFVVQRVQFDLRVGLDLFIESALLALERSHLGEMVLLGVLITLLGGRNRGLRLLHDPGVQMLVCSSCLINLFLFYSKTVTEEVMNLRLLVVLLNLSFVVRYSLRRSL
jgi:hypothetical protein